MKGEGADLFRVTSARMSTQIHVRQKTLDSDLTDIDKEELPHWEDNPRLLNLACIPETAILPTHSPTQNEHIKSDINSFTHTIRRVTEVTQRIQPSSKAKPAKRAGRQ